MLEGSGIWLKLTLSNSMTDAVAFARQTIAEVIMAFPV